MKKIKIFFWFVGVLISIYLILPGPSLPPPDLPESPKSTEPGDTVQIPNVAAYFTNKTREEVLAFYTDYFPSPFSFRLNYPPEYARDVFAPTKRSYFLEEIVRPGRESLFVNGFEWESDVFTPPERRIKNKIVIDGKVWLSKVSLRWFDSFWPVRLLVFWLAWGLFYLLLINWRKEVKEARRVF